MAGRHRIQFAAIGLAVLFAVAMVATARDNLTPDEWLQKMSSAVETLDYKGTVIRRQNGEIQPLKVVHKKIDGVINERIVIQEGNGLEVIRIGEEVHCILPDKKSVLIERWDNASTLFATLPNTSIEPGTQYDVLILDRGKRIAGRSTVMLAVRPNDNHRFEHRYWLDEETGFPLRTELVDHDGNVIDQLKFADIQIDANITAQSLAPSINIDSFSWYEDPAPKPVDKVESEWVSDALPAGFKILFVRREFLSGSEDPVTHIVYGDGLARVSVFISEMRSEVLKTSAKRGASSSYSAEVEGYQITAVGEVPAETVQLIATSMRRE